LYNSIIVVFASHSLNMLSFKLKRLVLLDQARPADNSRQEMFVRRLLRQRLFSRARLETRARDRVVVRGTQRKSIFGSTTRPSGCDTCDQTSPFFHKPRHDTYTRVLITGTVSCHIYAVPLRNQARQPICASVTLTAHTRSRDISRKRSIASLSLLA